jgi:hypothetical protein
MAQVHTSLVTPQTQAHPDQRWVRLARAILHDLFGPAPQRSFTVQL